jgi:hypothetical protein
MKLKPIRTLSPVMLKGRVAGDLHEALTMYAEYYGSVHGEATDVWPLLVQMLRAFLDADREFQAWRRHTSRDAGGAAAGPGGGTGMRTRNE